jgi:cytochrome c biogenesis protein CcdA
MENLGSLLNSNIPVIAAFLLGLITAISPCPMATNIAAIAYVSRGIANRNYAVITSMLYTVGRMFSYSLIGVLIILIGIEIPGIALFLQDTGEKILGPLLIIIGILMLFIDRLSFGKGSELLTTFGNKVTKLGMFGGFLLGVIFALAFCPYSAVIYFGLLMPLALQSAEGIILPAIFAIGTGLPVLLFGILISLGISKISSWFNAVTRIEKIIRIVVAVIFIGIGIYYVIQIFI